MFKKIKLKHKPCLSKVIKPVLDKKLHQLKGKKEKLHLENLSSMYNFFYDNSTKKNKYNPDIVNVSMKSLEDCYGDNAKRYYQILLEAGLFYGHRKLRELYKTGSYFGYQLNGNTCNLKNDIPLTYSSVKINRKLLQEKFDINNNKAVIIKAEENKIEEKKCEIIPFEQPMKQIKIRANWRYTKDIDYKKGTEVLNPTNKQVYIVSGLRTKTGCIIALDAKWFYIYKNLLMPVGSNEQFIDTVYKFNDAREWFFHIHKYNESKKMEKEKLKQEEADMLKSRWVSPLNRFIK